MKAFVNQLIIQGYNACDLKLNERTERGTGKKYYDCYGSLYVRPFVKLPSKAEPIVEVKDSMIFTFKAFNHNAKLLCKYAKRGTLLMIIGSLYQQKFKRAETNKVEYFNFILIKEVYLADKKGEYHNMSVEDKLV